jgi:hypothetical protein
VGVTATEPFFSLPGVPVINDQGVLQGLALNGGLMGAQSMVTILDAAAIRKSLSDWLKAAPPSGGVQILGEEKSVPRSAANSS